MKYQAFLLFTAARLVTTFVNVVNFNHRKRANFYMNSGDIFSESDYKDSFDKSKMRFFRNTNTDNALYKLDKWKEYIENNPSVYPESSLNAINTGSQFVKYPDLIVKNINQTLYILEWQHSVKARKKDLFADVFVNSKKENRKLLISHMIYGTYSKSGVFTIYGITENPENTIHEFSIHYMIYALQNKLRKHKIRVDTNNLKYWAHGIYYFSLKNILKGPDGKPAVD